MKTSINGNQVSVEEYGNIPFYTARHIDTRARVYPVAVFGHQTGHDGKMATMFVPSDASSHSAIQAIKVNMARHHWNAIGKEIDKMSISEAINHFNNNVDSMRMAVEDIEQFITINMPVVGSREVVEGFIKVAYDGFDTIDNGNKSSMIIAYDGSCSGIQFASAITRDEEMAASVNIAGAVIRQDIYQDVVDSIIEFVNSGVESKWITEEVKEVINSSRFGRAQVKQAVMTMAYGSEFYTIMQDAFKHFKGVDSVTVTNIAHIIEVARAKVTGSAMRMMEMFNMINRNIVGIATYTHRDGFVYSNSKAVYKGGHIVAGGNDGKKGQSAIAPDLIHSFDSAHVRAVVNRAPFDIVTIHDSFGCAPQHAEELNIIIREEFIKLFDGNRNVMEEFYMENKHMIPVADQADIEKAISEFEFGMLDISSVMNNEFAWS